MQFCRLARRRTTCLNFRRMEIEDIALTMTPALGVRGVVHLLNLFGNARAVFAASEQELVRRAELRPDLARNIASRKGMRQAERELEYCRRNGVLPVASTDEAYPALLREIDDYPHVIYVRGSVEALSLRAISFVGTRRMTPYGERMCMQLVEGLARLVPGLCIVSQSGNLAPADKKLYALRDVTATVESIPLIASSIMSKKLAGGSDCIVLDVKVGSGAFMKDTASARILAEKMVKIGKKCGRNIAAVITDMDVPLGYAVGNALEVKEAIDLLKGKNISDLRQICIAVSAHLVSMCLGISLQEAEEKANKALTNGAAFAKFKEWISAQGADADWADDTNKFPKAPVEYELLSEKDGYISHMDAEMIGRASMELGAGRKTKDDMIDHAAGIVLRIKNGEYVKRGDVLATLYTSDDKKLCRAKELYLSALEFSDKKPINGKLIIDIVK